MSKGTNQRQAQTKSFTFISIVPDGTSLLNRITRLILPSGLTLVVVVVILFFVLSQGLAELFFEMGLIGSTLFNLVAVLGPIESI